MEKYQRVKLDRREFMRFTRRGGPGVVGRQRGGDGAEEVTEDGSRWIKIYQIARDIFSNNNAQKLTVLPRNNPDYV